MVKLRSFSLVEVLVAIIILLGSLSIGLVGLNTMFSYLSFRKVEAQISIESIFLEEMKVNKGFKNGYEALNNEGNTEIVIQINNQTYSRIKE